MDRARRAEPYSNATIWTREIARNLAGHLDRLSKVHSCVDSASPKSGIHSVHTKHPHKRIGHVSPLKHDRSAPRPMEERDEPLSGDGDGLQSATARELGGSSTPRRRRRVKTLESIKTVPNRQVIEKETPDSLQQENLHLQDRSTEPTAAAGIHAEYLESVLTHTKKGPPLDYHRRQKQQRIWEENQALAKRLRNTKPTLSSKDWEKDDKWNQSYLKTQERRRQALQHEMARTLASPHSALIRVKHTSSQATARPQTDFGFGEDTAPMLTTIEVTTHDPKLSGRDLRRRRSADEDHTKEQRYQSTAPNHRRIMELRKQKERGDEGKQPRRVTESSDGGTTGTGPPDELVSVRFTFSRDGSRGLCTPNGITGQFSPAVELEAALEASCPDVDAFLQPVPLLEPPATSRLDTDEADVDTSEIIFETLQACIDTVVSIAEQAEVVESAAMDELQRVDLRLNVEEDATQTNEDTAETEPRARETIACGEEDHQNAPEHSEAGIDSGGDPSVERFGRNEGEVAQDESGRLSQVHDQPNEATNLHNAVVPDPLNVSETIDNLQTMVNVIVPDSPTHDMETSAYGSEFDADESALTPRGGSSEPIVPTLLEEPTGEDQYDDDHMDDDNDSHYDDDLEPETDRGVHDDEPMYDDEGFADD